MVKLIDIMVILTISELFYIKLWCEKWKNPNFTSYNLFNKFFICILALILHKLMYISYY